MPSSGIAVYVSDVVHVTLNQLLDDRVHEFIHAES